MANTDVFADFVQFYRERQASEMSLEAYLELCRDDPKTYASAAERILTRSASPSLSTRRKTRGSAAFS